MKRSPIRWEEIRTRLRANEKALAETIAGNPARIKAVFHARGIQLARKHAEDKSASKGAPALIFRVSRERYAIKLSELAEVVPFRNCTPVPGTSSRLSGVINLRGELRPVIDLGMVLSEKPSGDSGFVLVLRRQAGLKVDYIEDLHEIQPVDLAPVVADYGLGVIPYFSLASGFLTGKYRSEADAEDKPRGGIVSKYLNARGFGVVAALDEVARDYKSTPAGVALAWLIAQPGITAPIASATNEKQLADLVNAADLKLDAAAIEKLSATTR